MWHKEGRRQKVGFARGRYLKLGHRFEECGLCLGRCPIDFIGEKNVREYGSGFELHGAASVDGVLNRSGPGYVGWHQIDRELNAREVEMERFGQGADDQGLTDSGYAFDQDVTPGEKSYQDLANRGAVPDHHFADLFFECFEGGAKLLGAG